MRKVIYACLLAAASASAFADQRVVSDVISTAQAAADAHHAEMTAQLKSEDDTAMDRVVTVCDCVHGVSVYRHTTVRQYLNEGKALAMKARLLETLVSEPTAMRLLSSCH
ncbi:hypothetical protein [Paraburkholderia caribensis]|uniref:hypothetical protein n=1 Tax=Paraburkholderia caribensis TaxID=75105 RepID=UPI00285452CE|nr:hypothetical protein [Paraburkholderia caribensis]MDR6384018.1 hypothetical protein [Paraburkholderia caribensis]